MVSFLELHATLRPRLAELEARCLAVHKDVARLAYDADDESATALAHALVRARIFFDGTGDSLYSNFSAHLLYPILVLTLL